MDYQRFYKQLFQPIEERIGHVDEASIVAIIGFDCGGPITLCTVGRGRESFVTYVTCELAVRDEQQPAECGRYEIMMTCDDERWAHKILTKIGQMSLESAFAHGHTIDVGPVVGADCPLQGLVVEEFARVAIDGQSYGILYFHGVTRSELEFAMESGTDQLLARLRRADIYPHTSIHRKESVETAASTSRRSQPPLALSVPLSRFTPRVGGGSAFSFGETMKPTAQLKRIAALAISIILVLLVIHFYGAQLGLGFALVDHFLPGVVSSQSLKRAVMHPESNDAYSAYQRLGQRRSEVAHDIALQQVSSIDDYLWMNAAHYLGCIGDSASIPYLIKALRHTAWRSDEERRQLLVKLTSEDFGTDFTKWQQWWLSQHPDFKIDWESHLGFHPRLQHEKSPNQPHAANSRHPGQWRLEGLGMAAVADAERWTETV